MHKEVEDLLKRFPGQFRLATAEEQNEDSPVIIVFNHPAPKEKEEKRERKSSSKK